MQIIGQISNIDMINKWKEIPNFIIIQGDRHTGKTYLAKYIAEKFNMRYRKLNNGIKDVRKFKEDIVVNEHVVYHFKDFDKASLSAKSALLKITEETPEGNTIIITGNRQIPTLESRARKIVMSAYTQEEMLTFLEECFEGKLLKYYNAGINTPAKALLYRDCDEINDLLDFAYSTYSQLPVITEDLVVYIQGRFNNKYDKGVDVAILFLEMLINIINYKSKNELYYKYSFQNVLYILVEGKRLLERDKALNRKFMIYKIFYDILLLRGEL